jgi:glycine/D-amino acid oxidase-like deaminating enzyme
LSASSIRQQFSTPINIALSQYGIAFLRGIGGEVGLVDPGYLYLGDGASATALARNHAIQRACGAPVALLSPAELRRCFPWLGTQGLALGSLGLAGEGWFDGYALLQLVPPPRPRRGDPLCHRRGNRLRAARRPHRRGAPRGGRAPRLRCRGHRCRPVGRRGRGAGIELPVRPRRRSVYVFDSRERPAGMPLVIDPSGLWFRPEGAHTICGVPPADDPDAPPLDCEWDRFDTVVWPALARRVPAFAAIRPVGGWAGYYDYNTFDQNGIVGPVPGLDNLILANGFSGHGLQQAPAVGRAVAEWITAGRYQSLDLSPLGYDRLAEGRPLREDNVI